MRCLVEGEGDDVGVEGGGTAGHGDGELSDISPHVIIGVLLIQ